jgi:16S rRNA (guanine527-N7)-methyltransferase
MLAAAAARVRVTSVPREEWVRRHFAESLELLRIVLERSACESLADVGSGGGFPGLVIAAVRPGCVVHLIEPLQKRARLLVDMAEELGLTNVSVHPVRAEEAGRGPLRDSCGVVTARAVAGLSELLEYTAPLARPSGLIALAKGSGLEEEVSAAGAACEALRCALVGIEAMRAEVAKVGFVALFEKTGATPERYPRRAGIPAKRPIRQKR